MQAETFLWGADVDHTGGLPVRIFSVAYFAYDATQIVSPSSCIRFFIVDLEDEKPAEVPAYASNPYYEDEDETPIFKDRSDYCPICDCHNGHALSCATLNVNKKTITAEAVEVGTLKAIDHI